MASTHGFPGSLRLGPLEEIFSGFVKVSGFINFRVFGLVGVYTERTFGFLTVNEMVNKQFVASATRNKMPPKRRLRLGGDDSIVPSPTSLTAYICN